MARTAPHSSKSAIMPTFRISKPARLDLFVQPVLSHFVGGSGFVSSAVGIGMNVVPPHFFRLVRIVFFEKNKQINIQYKHKNLKLPFSSNTFGNKSTITNNTTHFGIQ